MHRPTIKIVKFYPGRFVELAIDEESGAHLLGIPFDVGGAGHTHYFKITEEDFQECLEDEARLDRLEKNGVFLKGTSHLYWSNYVPELELINQLRTTGSD